MAEDAAREAVAVGDLQVAAVGEATAEANQ